MIIFAPPGALHHNNRINKHHELPHPSTLIITKYYTLSPHTLHLSPFSKFSMNFIQDFQVLASMIKQHCRCFTLILLFLILGIQHAFSQAESPGIHDLSYSLQWLKGDEVSHVCVVGNHSLNPQSSAGNISDVILIVSNKIMERIAGSKEYAWRWVKENVVGIQIEVRIFIAMGQELFTKETHLLPLLIPAMESMDLALSAARLNQSVRVSTVIPSSLFTTAIFLEQISTKVDVMQKVLDFLSRTSSYLMFEAYIREKPYDELRFLNKTTAGGIRGEVSQAGCHYPFLSGLLTASMFMSSGDKLQIPHVGVQGLCTTLALREENSHQAEGNGGLCMFPMQEDSDLHTIVSERRKIKEITYTSDYCDTIGCTWCVARADASSRSVKAALDYACGEGGADCKAIARGGVCFHPNTLRDHASYIFNLYYQNNPHAPHACDFNGAATITKYNPSYGKCNYLSKDCIGNSGSRLQLLGLQMIITLLVPATGWCLLFL